ncbi:acid-sensing ion channel 4 [Plakobranchus ocellatus]|uniref:Acid-sensing ion channel 4 n=1 Tax=Plakobranchus ocellatus TaxID=259542 RepID=A0AAV4CTZ4_9GAST|nr:acid-sensing ion channel 4 [Plakobranchus ocellatus]
MHGQTDKKADRQKNKVGRRQRTDKIIIIYNPITITTTTTTTITTTINININDITAFIEDSSVSNLPQPHGQCSSPTLRHFQHYSTEACEVDCKTRLLEELCGCRLHYMPGAHVVPECSLQKYYQCYIRNSGKLRRLFATTCKCPVPCEFLIYDTSVSQAATSPLSVDRFLAQTDQSDLKARYDAARDVTHRLQKEKRDRLNHLIENLDLHFGQVRHLVLNQIETKIEQQRAAFAKVVTDVDKVHKQTMYLFEYQRYIVDKDFVRARDAMNERTLSVVCLAFQEFIVQVEAAIQSLSDKNITEPEVRRVLYLDVARKLESRKDMAERAHANYTEFRHALETGTPIFNYKFKSEPRANSPLIAPLPMFYQALNSSSSMRHRAVVLGQNLMNISHRLDTLKDLAERVYREGDLNATELHLQSVNFLFQCRTFSQSRDMFMYDTPEIIARLMKKRDDRLAKLWAQFEAAKTDFHRQADSLMSELQLIQTGALGGIARALTLARMFLQHGNLSKRMVAAEFLREDIVKTQGTLKNFFAEVRSRGHAVYDDWIKIKKAAIAIWFLALTEENLQTYYTAMNMTHMLVDVWDKRVEIATDCGRPRDEHDLRRVVNNVDAQFTDALSDMLKEMTNFRETEGIDGRFMRENILHLSIFYKALSYEQITQQEAYDVFALLCDIGGSMGLFLGASVITVFEVMDLLVFTYLARLLLPRAKDVSTKSTQVDL